MQQGTQNNTFQWPCSPKEKQQEFKITTCHSVSTLSGTHCTLFSLEALRQHTVISFLPSHSNAFAYLPSYLNLLVNIINNHCWLIVVCKLRAFYKWAAHSPCGSCSQSLIQWRFYLMLRFTFVFYVQEVAPAEILFQKGHYLTQRKKMKSYRVPEHQQSWKKSGENCLELKQLQTFGELMKWMVLNKQNQNQMLP